jgi:hypothetical protein
MNKTDESGRISYGAEIKSIQMPDISIGSAFITSVGVYKEKPEWSVLEVLEGSEVTEYVIPYPRGEVVDIIQDQQQTMFALFVAHAWDTIRSYE